MSKLYPILAILIITMGLSPAFADSIPYWGEQFDVKTPNICIFEPEEEIEFDELNLLNMTKWAIWEWRYRLMIYTEENNWGFNTTYYNIESETEFWKEDCDISIIYKKYSVEIDKEKREVHTKTGETGIYEVKNKSSRLITLFTYEVVSVDITNELEIADIEIKILTGNYLRLVTLHELGHAFGLSHLKVDCMRFCVNVQGGYADDDAKKSIMYWSVRGNANDFISDRDLGAIVQYYSEDGWGDYNRIDLSQYWWNTSK